MTLQELVRKYTLNRDERYWDEPAYVRYVVDTVCRCIENDVKPDDTESQDVHRAYGYVMSDPMYRQFRSESHKLKLLTSNEQVCDWLGIEGWEAPPPYPAEYPCFGYTEVTDWVTQESRPVYVYVNDFKNMLGKLDTLGVMV